MNGSIQEKIKRTRAPRVTLTYDREEFGAIQKKELPFVVGVIADLSGHTRPSDKLKERHFVSIDRDNFNGVMASVKPTLNLKVQNTIADDGSQLGVALQFNHIDDFEPSQLVEQVAPLRKALELRRSLTELLARMDVDDTLVERLSDIVRDTEKLSALAAALQDGQSDPSN